MDLATKARIKSKLAAKGLYWTDAQIEAYADQLLEEQPIAPTPQEEPAYPMGMPAAPSGFLESIPGVDATKDLIGNTLWQALDVGTFGLAGWGAKTVAPDLYEDLMEDWNSSMAGRMGGAIGGLAGFLMPMGAVARGTSLAARGIRGALQSKKIKAGLTVAKPTTRTLQKQAAKEIMKASEKEALRAGGKALTRKEAEKIAIESSDDMIGFTQKGWLRRIGGKGPAYQLEHSVERVNQVRQNMQRIMPERLATSLSRKGINLSKDQVARLSDDVVDMIATKPFNSIETIIAGKYSGRFVAPMMNVIGGVAQEAVNFGIVGTAMDAVQYGKGELDYDQESFGDRVLHHALIGLMFGGVRFVPGGRARPIWRDVVAYSGRSTKKLNAQVAKMGLDEAKAFARMTKKNDKSIQYTVNGRKVSLKELRKGTGIGEGELSALKNAIIKRNSEKLKQFKKLGDFGPEIARDLLSSAPRMAIGSIIFNLASLQDDAFYNLHPSETLFHLGLGALMTKSGRPLIRGKSARFGLGEKEYYYNSDLRDIKQEMDRAYLTGESIGDIVKQFDGNLFTDWAAVNKIQDVENVIQVLKENNVVYDRTETGLIATDKFNEAALANRELLNLISPLRPAMQSRNIEMNPNATKKQLNNALEAIRGTESIGLSTAEKKVFLNSRRNIINSIYEGASEGWTRIQKSLYDNFSQQIGLLADDPAYLGKDGKMHEYFYDDVGYTTSEQMVLRKLEDLRESFQDMDLVKITDFTTGKGQGMPMKLTSDKIQKIKQVQEGWEFDIGREFYGKDSNMPIDMGDKSMWNLLSSIDYHKNVARVHDVMMGKEVPGIAKEDANSIQSLLHETLSHTENKDRNIIVDTPTKIHLESEGMGTPEEFFMLQDMLSNLWSISNASGRRPSDIKSVKVDISKARSLKEKLVNAGMPDPETHSFGLDSRMQNWIDRAVDHSLDQVMGGLDMEPNKAVAIKRLMMNGVIQTRVDRDGRSLGLQAAAKITAKQVEQIMPGITSSDAQNIVRAYDVVMDKLGTKLVSPREDFQITSLTENQLSSILSAEHLMEPARIKREIEDKQDDIGIKIVGVRQDYKILEKSLENAAPDAINEIKTLMEHNLAVDREYSRIQTSFIKTFGSNVEMSRASAHLFFMKKMTGPDGKTIEDYLNVLSDTKLGTEFNSMTDQIRDLQTAIANKVAERADVRTWDDKRQEAEARRKQEEIEGHMPEDNEYITPELFFDKHEIKIEDVFKKGEVGHGITYDSAGDVVYELYKQKGIEGFTERLFNLAGTSTKKAETQIRNEVMHVSNLFERRYNVKRLAISDGGGVFERADISKGYLTDLYSEAFRGDTEMIILSSDYFLGNRFYNTATNPEGMTYINSVVNSDAFAATLKNGGVTNMKYQKVGHTTGAEPGKEYYETIDLGGQSVSGRHYIIGVDENINLLIPEAGFNNLADSFVRWYEKTVDTPYVKNSRRKMSGAKDLFKELDGYYESLKEIKKTKGEYYPEVFRDSGRTKREDYMEDAIYTIFNSMYGEKIDGDWLQDAYFNASRSRKSYKYKRLAQNQGYSRNSNERKQLLKSIYDGTTNKYYKKLLKKYTDKEKIHVAIINDSREGMVSEKGQSALGFITDNRSIAEAKLESMKKNGDINDDAYQSMKKILLEGNSINAEAINGMTVVRRELLDYLLLLSGQENLIGSSSGQKPVGLSNFKDDSGNIHVFYNKTHYFYDSRLDPFFKHKGNKDIDQIVMTSGAKKAKIVNENDTRLADKFEPISDIPTMESGKTLVDFINGLRLREGDQGVMPVMFDQTLSGTVYGGPKGAKIMKQFDNWTSDKVQSDLYQWARADLAEQFSEVNIHLYNPENIGMASREAKSFIRSEGNKDGTLSTDAPNASIGSIWIEAGGVPFSEMSKNLYDALIKRRHIQDAGVFDGYTDAGGVPVLRGNLSMDLNIPVYHDNVQLKLGEAHVSSSYLDRVIHYRGAFGGAIKKDPGVKQRPQYVDKSSLTIAFAHEGRDIIVDLKKGTVFDPTKPKAKLSDYKDINKMVESLTKRLAAEDGLSTYRDVWNELQDVGGDIFTTAKGSVYAVDGTRTTRTKAARDEHPGDFGLKDKSTVTLYMEQTTAQNLFGKPFGAMSTAKKKALGFNKLGITLDGKTYGAKSKPTKGLLPVELWRDADGNLQSYHVGNKIIEITKGRPSYKGAQLAVMAMPAPRTGPHDAMVVKIKNMLDSKDGGLIEMNVYDATMRAQRDMDTDKLPFYMDTPFSAMKEAFSQNGSLKEAMPTIDKNIPDLDMYNNQSFKKYNQNIQTFKRLRGPILKMHRKLSYAKRLFDSIDGIDIGNGNRIVFTGDANKAKQRLVDDSQNVLDIYEGTSGLLTDINKWGERTLFGNSQKDDIGVVNIDTDKPFFQIRNEKGGHSALSLKEDRAIVTKILNDFGRLLQIESSVYEAGEAKTPRYADMVSAYRDFKHEYNRKSVDWNFYNYIKKSIGEPEADKIFFKDAKAKEAKMITPIFGGLADKILDNPTPFLKSLHHIAEKDAVKVRETYGYSGSDFFNNGVQKLVGRNHAEAFELFSRTGVLAEGDLNRKNNLINDLWDQFESGRKHEQMMVQANTIETELRRSERSLELEKKKQYRDEAYIAMQEENILIKSEALAAMLNKMAITPAEDGTSRYGQSIRHHSFKEGANNTIKEDYRPVVIRDKRTGDFIRGVKPGQEHPLKRNEVAVYNPITLKPVVEHELIDGAAYAYSVLGRYSHILENDLPEFRRIVNNTKTNIKKSAREMMTKKGYRDWSKHQQSTQAAIDAGLKRVKRLATRDALDMIDNKDTWMGQVPSNRATYGEDFLMSLLLPDYGANPNELHYSPKTGNFMPAVEAPKKSVINGVMKAMELYQVTPNFKGFVQDFARTHRGFYESIVAGRGFHEGLERLNGSNFESALLSTTIGKVMNNTFMPRKDYKTMDETFDAMPPILSDYAELYRQVLQEGALADPMTAFKLRKQVIEDPSLGPEAYNRIFQMARGHLVLDGYTARQYGITQGEGQILGEVLMNRSDVKRRQITGSKKSRDGSEITDFLDHQVGRENAIREKCD